MDYRRRALLRSKETPPTTPPANRLDRVVAISSIASNIVIGVGTLVLAAMGFNLTRDFNQWQVKNTERQVVSDNKELLEKAIDRCYSRAGAVFGMIKGLGENEAATILQKTDGSTTSCKMMGLEIPDLAAYFIVKDPVNINPKIVQRASTRVAAASEKSLYNVRYRQLLKAYTAEIEQHNMTLKREIAATQLRIDQVSDRPRVLKEEEAQNLISALEMPRLSSFEDIMKRRLSNKECQSKLDAEVKAKPSEPSWSVKCDDGRTLSRDAF